MFQYGHDPLAEQVNEITVLVLVFGKKIERNNHGTEKYHVRAGFNPPF